MGSLLQQPVIQVNQVSLAGHLGIQVIQVILGHHKTCPSPAQPNYNNQEAGGRVYSRKLQSLYQDRPQLQLEVWHWHHLALLLAARVHKRIR